MSILQVSIILHYWCSPEEYKNSDSDAFCEAVAAFVKHGILIDTGAQIGTPRYKINDPIAKPYIDAVTSVPLPVSVQGWEIPEYKIKSY